MAHAVALKLWTVRVVRNVMRGLWHCAQECPPPLGSSRSQDLLDDVQLQHYMEQQSATLMVTVLEACGMQPRKGAPDSLLTSSCCCLAPHFVVVASLEQICSTAVCNFALQKKQSPGTALRCGFWCQMKRQGTAHASLRKATPCMQVLWWRFRQISCPTRWWRSACLGSPHTRCLPSTA